MQLSAKRQRKKDAREEEENKRRRKKMDRKAESKNIMGGSEEVDSEK